MQNLLSGLIQVQLFMLQILCRNSIRGGTFEEEKEALESNSMQEFYTRRTLRRGERSFRVTNSIKAEAEAIGELPLELNNGFILRLHNILYVPSLSRNLISVSCLDDDGYDCQFDNRQCLILYDNKVVALAFR
jgi:hypothetical protein